MRRIIIFMILVLPLLAYLLFISRQGPVTDFPISDPSTPDAPQHSSPPERAVLDISVHTIDELRVLLDRAESLAMAPHPTGKTASVVLVLHGPEVEFFTLGNYHKYKDIVDQAARLDAFDVVDVKICQSMMEIQGIPRDDIPSFIEQVPLGPAEIERLVGEGYVYF